MQDSKTQASNELSERDFASLKQKIVKQIERTQTTGSGALSEIENDAHWLMGRELNQIKRVGSATFVRLARETGKTVQFYYRVAQFQKVWNHGLTAAAKHLSFNCHLELFSLKDPERRHFYVREAVQARWPRAKLRQAIHRDYFTLAKNGEKLVAKLDRKTDPYNVYKAKLIDIIDGDTFKLEIDQGFSNKTTQIVRLRGVNCAEIKSLPKTAKRAQDAKAFVTARLSGLPFVTLKTFKTDIYGRYVADIFYTPTGTKGAEPVHLNQELLDQGLAVGMM